MPTPSNATTSQDKMPGIPKIKLPRYLLSVPNEPLQKKITDFISQVNDNCKELNRLIELYNSEGPSSSDSSKKSVLQQIYELKKKMDNKYPDEYIGFCPEYQKEIQIKLFSSLKQQFARQGVSSLTEKAIYGEPTNLDAPDTITEILANMPNDKVARLIQILIESKNIRLSLTNLYATGETGKITFDSFLKKNSISFLGGYNSKNFKVTHIATNESVVLKVENRMGMPKEAEVHLRGGPLKETLTPLSVARQATYLDKECNPITRTLLVTELCKGGDLIAYSTNQDRTSDALKIYQQMATVLVNMNQAQYIFTDMKNSNWLLDEKGHLRIADTKGFIPTTNEMYDKTVSDWYHPGWVVTPYMNPPEFNEIHSFNANKAHSYMLGKNIYEYLTKCSRKKLKNQHDADNYDFTDAIFQTEKGKLFEILIKKMVKKSPLNRISVQDAMLELEKIRIIDIKVECSALLYRIEAEAEAEGTPGFVASISKQINELNNENQSLELKDSIHVEMLKINCRQLLNKIKKQDHLFVTTQRETIDTTQDKSVLKDLENSLNRIHEKNIQNMAQLRFECLGLISEADANQVHAKDADLKRYMSNIPITICAAQNTQQLRLLKEDILLHREQILLKKECRDILNQGVHSDDKEMILYTANMTEKINKTQNKEAITELKKEITTHQNDENAVLRKDCYTLLNEIKQLRFGELDTEMDAFVQSQEDQINKGKDSLMLQRIKTELETIQKGMPAIAFIHRKVQSFRDNAHIYTQGMKDKANRIETAMRAVPIDQRASIMNSSAKKSLAVQTALASHRHVFRHLIHPKKNDPLNEKNAARSFGELKKEIQRLQQKEQASSKTASDNPNTPFNPE